MKLIFEESLPNLWKSSSSRSFERARLCLFKAQGGPTDDMAAKMYKRFKKTTKRSNNAQHHPDLVQQNFQVGDPNRVWVADITYISVKGRWVYLVVVLDLFSRKVVGMALQ